MHGRKEFKAPDNTGSGGAKIGEPAQKLVGEGSGGVTGVPLTAPASCFSAVASTESNGLPYLVQRNKQNIQLIRVTMLGW